MLHFVQHDRREAVRTSVMLNEVKHLRHGRRRFTCAIGLIEVTLVQGGRAHALRVRGDGLRDEQLRHDDIIIVIERDQAPVGSTVVALLDGRGAVIRRFERDGSRVRLTSASEHVPPIILRQGDLQIHGLVAGLVRRYWRPPAEA